MSATCQEVEVKDIGDLEKLVAKNIEGIESGLQVIDSRVLLGHAAIDLIGLDAKGALVLIALDFTASEGLLLRAMDAHSWRLETASAADATASVTRSSKSTQRRPRLGIHRA